MGGGLPRSVSHGIFLKLFHTFWVSPPCVRAAFDACTFIWTAVDPIGMVPGSVWRLGEVKENAYQKHAWKILFAIGVLFLLPAVPAIFDVDVDPIHDERIMGITLEEPEASNPVVFDLYIFHLRAIGVSVSVFAILSMGISMTAYKRAEKWASYALWSFPVVIIGVILTDI